MRKTITILFSLFAFTAIAQQLNFPLNYEMQNRLERYISTSSHFITGAKPYNMEEVQSAIGDSGMVELGFDIDSSRSGFRFGLLKGDLLSVSAKHKKFYFAVNPVLDMQFGYDINEKKIKYTAGYGVKFDANLGKHVSISFTYQGVSENYLHQVDQYAVQYGVLPGYRKATFKGNTVNSQMFSGYISLSPNKFFNLQLGNDKQFWGEGYRSLFLSDNASNNPYLKMTTNFWRIKYTYLFNVMRYGPVNGFSVDNNPSNFKTKYGVYHLISVDVAKWMQFTFFEGVTWFHEDSGRVRGIEFSYIIPVAFIRPVEFGLGSPDNVVLGIGMKFKASAKQIFYTQIMLDDMDVGAARKAKGFYRTKVAAQFGYKGYDIFRVKHLDFQTEFNVVRPYVYAHKAPQQSYTNFNQSLTHPLGANFLESITFINFWHKHWTASAKFQYVVQGLDNLYEHNGSNIFISDFLIGPDLNKAYGNYFLQGVKTRLISVEARGGYLINPKINLSAEAFVNYRYQKNILFKQQNLFFGISLRTNIFNRYTDF
ncbi:MAG: protein involved in gliding motility RemB [Bacteroidota bacterium]|nr:protein involved in gliding motility RemB [Bacteroidota bacterium]